LLSAWIPTEKGRALEKNLHDVTEGRCFTELTTAEEVEGVRSGQISVPALFRNAGWMRPFEPLMSSFGIPRYRTVNPTPFLAVTFLFMFGMMFGDVGHGGILVLIGAVMLRRKELVQLAKVLMMAGCASILFGFLYGSIFGLENVLPALWIQPMEEIESLVGIALGFGILMISLGIVLKIFNAFREKDWASLVFDKSGLLSGMFYWIVLGLACRAIWVSGSRIPSFAVVILIGLLLALLLKGVIMKLLRIRHEGEGEAISSQLIESVFELYETLLGLMTNTISFVRLAAFALGHVGISMGIYSLLSVMQDWPGSIIWRTLLVVAGNAVIILLEGLIVGIQTVRLEYFEFFCKFFGTGGVEYEPVSLEEME